MDDVTVLKARIEELEAFVVAEGDAHYSHREFEKMEAECAELKRFKSTILGWRENDWPEWFCRHTAEALADRGKENNNVG